MVTDPGKDPGRLLIHKIAETVHRMWGQTAPGQLRWSILGASISFSGPWNRADIQLDKHFTFETTAATLVLEWPSGIPIS